VTDATSLQNNLMSTTNYSNAGSNGAVSDRMVFGVEKPKLVINEVYSEIANDPTEATTAMAGPTQPAHVRFWVELLNPGTTPYANGGSGPQNNGAAQVRYEVADGVTTPYSPYSIVISRFNKTSTVASANVNVRQYLQDPSNVLGSHLPNTGANAPDLAYDFSNNQNGNSSRSVSPNNGNYGPSLTPANGCLLVGPKMPQTGSSPGPQPIEFNPQPGVAPYNVAPWLQMYQSAQQSGLPAANKPNNAMEYLLTVPTSGGGIGGLGGQDFSQHVVLLRRLANPYMLPNDPNNDPTLANFNPNLPAFNPLLPANPYITVDYMDYVPAFDAVNRSTTDTTTARSPKAGNPPSGANSYDPIGYRFSVGKVQPFASIAFASNPTANSTLPRSNYSYLTTCVLPQNPTGFAPATSTIPAFTFGQHNGTQSNGNNYTSGTNTALPSNASETIKAPFDWLVHFDRPLVNQLELLHVQACKPHEVSQFTSQPNNNAMSFGYTAHLGTAQWFGVTAAGLPGFDTSTTTNPNRLTNNGLFRALEVLRVKPWMYGVGAGGRTQGQLNINPMADVSLLQALLDPTPQPWTASTAYGSGQLVSNGSSVYVCSQAGTSGGSGGPSGYGAGINDGSVIWNYNKPAGNAFYTADVINLWNTAFSNTTQTGGIRTPNIHSTSTANGASVSVPQPGQTIDDASPSDPNRGNYDRPFKPFGYAEFSPGGTFGGMSAGSGIQDTLLRVNTTTGNPLAWVTSPSLYPAAGTGTSVPHPYFKAEMVRKMLNNTTTVSNAFAVNVTIVFYEVRMNGTTPMTVNEGAGNRFLLGKEAYQYAPGDLRQQFFAVVDRSNLVLNSTGVLQPKPYSGSLGVSSYAPPGQMLPIVGATQASNSLMPAPPMGYLTPQGPSNVYLDDVTAANSTPYTRSYGSTTTVYRDGQPIVLGPGTILAIGSGANMETLTVNYANDDGSLNVSSAPSKVHAAGEVVSNYLPGNPGPITIPSVYVNASNPGPFDVLTNPNSIYNGVVPYAKRVR
jgi:hypothetical protein